MAQVENLEVHVNGLALIFSLLPIKTLSRIAELHARPRLDVKIYSRRLKGRSVTLTFVTVAAPTYVEVSLCALLSLAVSRGPGAPRVSAAAAAQSLRGDVQPELCSHFHPPQLHPAHGAGQGPPDGHSRWRFADFRLVLQREKKYKNPSNGALAVFSHVCCLRHQNTRRCVTRR